MTRDAETMLWSAYRGGLLPVCRQPSSYPLISSDLLTTESRHEQRVTLFPDRHVAHQFVEEVFEEDGVMCAQAGVGDKMHRR